jgi:hypothetical protein
MKMPISTIKAELSSFQLYLPFKMKKDIIIVNGITLSERIDCNTPGVLDDANTSSRPLYPSYIFFGRIS